MKKLVRKLKNKFKNLLLRFRAYIVRLFFPLYLFPIKLATYSTYYILKFFIKLIFAIFGLIIDAIKFPFKSMKNFLKFILFFALTIYLFASLFVIVDYMRIHYGYFGKFFCAIIFNDKAQSMVVRIVGGYSEGSGFFIAPDQVITNFHVIADEPSPKIIFPDGKFITPVKIVGNKDVDLAILFTKDKYPSFVFPLPDTFSLYQNEPIIATGYPLGTELVGRATSLKGTFIDYRQSKQTPARYVQSDINLVQGMSGGPLTDQCGQVVGVNTMGLSGLSLFINSSFAKSVLPDFTDQAIVKINVDPSLSPEESVRAFYTYLKARRMEDGFNLLSKEYLKKTNFQEWTNRFKDILDVNVIKSEKYEDSEDTAFVKFSTKNWVDGEAEIHFYEGAWETVQEDGVYKMNKSKILEVDNPEWNWFYE